MKIRIIGSHECKVCQQIVSRFKLQISIIWEWVDANAPDTQELCDLYDVDILPHVQILDDKGNIVWQRASQELTYEEIVKKIDGLK